MIVYKVRRFEGYNRQYKRYNRNPYRLSITCSTDNSLSLLYTQHTVVESLIQSSEVKR